MQKLERRNTYTPTDTSLVYGNCDRVLNRDQSLSVPGLKTFSNNSEENYSQHRGSSDLRVQNTFVYVLNMRGQPLMPTTQQKANKLLKQNKAKIVKRTPFTIQLKNYATGETKQLITLGDDPGYTHIGLSAVTNKKELYSAETKLRTDLAKLNSERKTYRRTRRYRKTWYRKPRFLNRKKPEGWIAPSIQHKLDSHIKLVNKVQKILPISHIIVEAASFDIQKIKNPSIQGEEYQQGEQLGFWNVREYVIHRDNHTCQHCKGKSKDPILEVHHIMSRQIGGNRPDNLITMCRACHKKYHEGKIKLKNIKPNHGFKPETFMSTVRWMLINRLRELGYTVSHTYGYITKNNRILLGIPKSHNNDAFVIAGGRNQERTGYIYVSKQVRRQNRSLYKANLLKGGKLKRNTVREVKDFRRFDKVLFGKVKCFIYGLRSSGYFDLRGIDGNKIGASVNHKKLRLLEHARGKITEVKNVLIPPTTKVGGILSTS